SDGSPFSISSVSSTIIKSEVKLFQDIKLSTETPYSWPISLKVSPSFTLYSSAEALVAKAPNKTAPAANDINTFFIYVFLLYSYCDSQRFLTSTIILTYKLFLNSYKTIKNT